VKFGLVSTTCSLCVAWVSVGPVKMFGVCVPRPGAAKLLSKSWKAVADYFSSTRCFIGQLLQHESRSQEASVFQVFHQILSLAMRAFCGKLIPSLPVPSAFAATMLYRDIPVPLPDHWLETVPARSSSYLSSRALAATSRKVRPRL